MVATVATVARLLRRSSGALGGGLAANAAWVGFGAGGGLSGEVARLRSGPPRRWINLGSEHYSDVLGGDGEAPAVLRGYTEDGFLLGDAAAPIKGALLCFERRCFVWDGVRGVDGIDRDKLAILRAVKPKPDILVVGCGKRGAKGAGALSADVRRMLYDDNISLIAVDTPSAMSTFNILQQEGRRVMAALLPC
mmetsp:Transcript_14254/g.35918  ORF Transcript_14254/g.35918 Transcript_14254/m.35918 type:complete len:193 (+) Transcript_14254:68-646(+)